PLRRAEERWKRSSARRLPCSRSTTCARQWTKRCRFPMCVYSARPSTTCKREVFSCHPEPVLSVTMLLCASIVKACRYKLVLSRSRIAPAQDIMRILADPRAEKRRKRREGKSYRKQLFPMTRNGLSRRSVRFHNKAVV